MDGYFEQFLDLTLSKNEVPFRGDTCLNGYTLSILNIEVMCGSGRKAGSS